MSGWIGVDLDGTLAHYDGWQGEFHIGDPVPAMLARVKQWLKDGHEIKIFTARIAVEQPLRNEIIREIHAWLDSVGLPFLQVTNVKDFGMLELWDDRCVQVIANTGKRADGRE